MKIAFTSDNHFNFLGDPSKVVRKMSKAVSKWGADAVCIGGDLCHPVNEDKVNRAISNVLTMHKKVYFVIGNHDLWGVDNFPTLTPPDAFDTYMKTIFKAGLPLERSFSKDECTIYEDGDAVFVGTMGFPDFAHPGFTKGARYYDFNGCTNDVSYIKLSLGWLYYTIPMQKAFFKRLGRAVASKAKDIIVVTHYGILDKQRIVSNDDIAAYFFNYSIGQEVLRLAKEHPDKRFWCLSGHSHEYCTGSLTMASENVYAFGLKTDYYSQHVFFLDTDAEMNQDREAKVVA